MIANYYTLLHVARDLDQRLSGKQFHEIFSQNKNELIICCGEEDFVVVSCEPSANYITHRDSFARAKKNSVNLFQPLVGRTIRSVSLSLGDREVIFRTDEKASLIVQMFGSKANVFLVTTDYTIQQSFLKPKDSVGTIYAPRQSMYQGFSNGKDFGASLSSLKDATAQTALKKMFPQLGSLLVQELIDRAGIQEDINISAAQHVSALFSAYVDLLSNLTSRPSPRIYFDGSLPKEFSIVPLSKHANLEMRTFVSIHEAIRTFVSGQQRDKQFCEQKNELAKVVAHEVERSERTLQKLSQEMQSGDRAKEYETIGKLLMANLGVVRKGLKKVQLENIFAAPSSTLTIQLEPALTATQNAERYFQKSKKARSAQEENHQRKDRLTRLVHDGRRLLTELDNLESTEGLQKFTSEHRDLLTTFGVRLNRHGKRLHEERVPFRIFTVSGGFEVWVGKSSENNDLLTVKYAKPNDLWFHARGSSGSHVVLKVGTGKGEPGKQAIEQAAAIAAYYSKMKNSKTVPVAMTQKKYVRKPRRAPAGTVTIEREKLFFVEPKLPTPL
ncbi:MAG: DUF814 domain-containing protein [Ignavibacteriales bacterium]|nr:DUF814 domain-containing protein [Ignavibacteriales bacterium]